MDECYGVIRVVSKDKATIDRLYKILNYKDSEYHLYGCRDCERLDNGIEENGFWRSDFEIVGRCSCAPFIYEEDNENKLYIKDYQRREDGSYDMDKPIYGSSHITNLCVLAQRLGFGCELYDEQSECAFCEHFAIDHNGEIVYAEDGDYNEVFPLDENGEPNYDAECKFVYGIDGYMDFSKAEEIYR